MTTERDGLGEPAGTRAGRECDRTAGAGRSRAPTRVLSPCCRFLFGSFLATGFTSLVVTHVAWLLGMVRFMFPNIVIEPPTKFRVGLPDDYAPGQVESRFIAQFGVWIVRHEYEGRPQIYALRAVCTHLGCTPELAGSGAEVQVSLPRQRVLQGRDQFRGSGAAAAGTLRDPHRRRRPVGGRQEPRSSRRNWASGRTRTAFVDE